MKRYFDGNRIENITKAGSARKNPMDFNPCSEEKRSEIRNTCTARNMSRTTSMIFLAKKGIKENGIITTSHFVLFESKSPSALSGKLCLCTLVESKR